MKLGIVLVAGAYGQNMLCPSGWTASAYADDCYLRSSSSMNFEAADRYCKDLGGVVLTPRTEAENYWMSNTIVGNVWTGVTDRHSEGTWVHEHDRSQVSTFFWYSGEPNGANHENCIEIAHGLSQRWNDVSCTANMHVFCQIDKYEQTTQPPVTVEPTPVYDGPNFIVVDFKHGDVSLGEGGIIDFKLLTCDLNTVTAPVEMTGQNTGTINMGAMATGHSPTNILQVTPTTGDGTFLEYVKVYECNKAAADDLDVSGCRLAGSYENFWIDGPCTADEYQGHQCVDGLSIEDFRIDGNRTYAGADDHWGKCQTPDRSDCADGMSSLVDKDGHYNSDFAGACMPTYDAIKVASCNFGDFFSGENDDDGRVALTAEIKREVFELIPAELVTYGETADGRAIEPWVLNTATDYYVKTFELDELTEVPDATDPDNYIRFEPTREIIATGKYGQAGAEGVYISVGLRITLACRYSMADQVLLADLTVKGQDFEAARINEGKIYYKLQMDGDDYTIGDTATFQLIPSTLNLAYAVVNKCTISREVKPGDMRTATILGEDGNRCLNHFVSTTLEGFNTMDTMTGTFTAFKWSTDIHDEFKEEQDFECDISISREKYTDAEPVQCPAYPITGGSGK